MYIDSIVHKNYVCFRNRIWLDSIEIIDNLLVCFKIVRFFMLSNLIKLGNCSQDVWTFGSATKSKYVCFLLFFVIRLILDSILMPLLRSSMVRISFRISEMNKDYFIQLTILKQF